ncbi:hypothetical protein BDZ97DRAFT_1759010 [Flammula alnicola]|nr:hypothetical protein BDZ97DRAFT_1759010 [Flammula alnicola]
MRTSRWPTSVALAARLSQRSIGDSYLENRFRHFRKLSYKVAKSVTSVVWFDVYTSDSTFRLAMILPNAVIANIMFSWVFRKTKLGLSAVVTTSASNAQCRQTTLVAPKNQMILGPQMTRSCENGPEGFHAFRGPVEVTITEVVEYKHDVLEFQEDRQRAFRTSSFMSQCHGSCKNVEYFQEGQWNFGRSYSGENMGGIRLWGLSESLIVWSHSSMEPRPQMAGLIALHYLGFLDPPHDVVDAAFGFGPLGPWPKAMQDTFKRLPGCQERVSAPCRGRILVNMCQQCTEMAGGPKIWYLRASRGAGMGGLGLAGLDDGPIWGGADGKYLSTMQEMMSGVVFWVLLVVGGGFRGNIQENSNKRVLLLRRKQRGKGGLGLSVPLFSKITEYLEHKKDALGKELAAAASVAPPRPLPSSASILHPLLGDLPICQFLRLQYSSAMLFLGFRVDRGAVPRSFVLLKIQAGSWAIDVAATRLQTDSRGGWNATSNVVCTTFEVKEGRRMVVVLPLAGVV